MTEWYSNKWHLVCVLAFALTGCSGTGPASGPPNVFHKDVHRGIVVAETMELYSLDPDDSQQHSDGFHGFRILGSMSIQNGGTQSKIDHDLKAAVPPYAGPVATCFRPRHGLRCVVEGKRYDVVISFECRQMRCYIEDKEVEGCQIDSSLESYLTDLLRKAGIPLADPPK